MRNGLFLGTLILALAGGQGLALGLTPAAAGTKAAAAGTGTVVLAGGGLSDDNRALWQALCQAARSVSRHERPRIAVIGSGRPSLQVARAAFYQDEDGHLSYQNLFRRYGFDPVFVPIAIDAYRSVNSDPAVVSLVTGADAVWFGGGSQAYHARCFLQDDGSDTPLMTAVRGVHRKGGVVGGTSAGAAVMDEFTYGEARSHGYFLANSLLYRPLAAMHDGRDSSLASEGPGGGYTRGLGMVADIDAAVDTHVNARGRYGRVMVAMRALKYRYGIAVSEDTALFIKGKRGTVMGADRVLIADGTAARYGSDQYFQVSDLMLSSLRGSDGFDFATGTATSARPAVSGNGTAPGFDASDVFGGAELPKALETLGASGQSAASGRSREVTPTGFRLDLKRSPRTLATRDPATGRLSVLHVTATVTPTAP